MFICLNQICGYTDLCHEVEELRKEPYSSEDATHEERLMQVHCPDSLVFKVYYFLAVSSILTTIYYYSH